MVANRVGFFDTVNLKAPPGYPASEFCFAVMGIEDVDDRLVSARQDKFGRANFDGPFVTHVQAERHGQRTTLQTSCHRSKIRPWMPFAQP
jgi:hypothetical protein